MPFTFKWATDALVDDPGQPAWGWVMAVPLTMTAAYGGMRIVMALLTQARDGLFAKVAMNAVRRLAVMTFEHMHQLSLRFHLERKTGGLTRVLERGRNAIETIVRMVILQLIPTIVEVALICAVLLYQFDWRYVLVIFVTVALYIWYTYLATEWRIGIRRKMNESDTDANTKAIDSLLNYETVKYFSAEERETARYDRSMERYEHASVQAYVSLAVLNAGQATIFTIGLTVTMALTVYGIKSGTQSIGDFVMINAMMIQLYQPLELHGHGLSRDQAGGDRHRADVHDPRPRVRDQGSRPARRRSWSPRARSASRTCTSPTSRRGRSCSGISASRCRPGAPSRSSGRRAPASRPSRACCSASTRSPAAASPSTARTSATSPRRSLRNAIGMVPQDTVLFNDTMRYNIRYGRWDATDAEVEEAATHAQIDAFIRSTPKGYDTEVGERGLKLSGGEKQRVAIARTILKGPPILVLDEATSALDSHTEKDIQDALDRVSREPHHARHRPPPLHHHRRRRDHRARQGRHRRARHPPAAAGGRRALCQHVEPAARGRRGARDARPRRRGRRRAQPQCRRAGRRTAEVAATPRRHHRRRRRGVSMSIVASIRSQLVPINPEGYPFIAGFALASLFLMWLWSPLGWLGVVATLWCVYFFRDPPRVTPLRDGLVISPADGRVSRIANAVPPPELALGDRAGAAHLDLHERVRLPREPQPGRRPHRAHRLPRRARSSMPISTRRARTTSATAS